MNLYKGYIPTDGKMATMPFKNKSSNELFKLERVSNFPSYAGVLSDDTILVDIDDYEQSEILLEIVKTKGLK